MKFMLIESRLFSTLPALFLLLAGGAGGLKAGTNSPNSVNLASSANPAALSQPVTFTVTIVGFSDMGPTGTVTFFDGNGELGASDLPAPPAGVSTNSTTFNFSFTLVGIHNITAQYSGDAFYSSTTSGILAEKIQGGTTLSLSASDNPIVVGQTLTLTAAVFPVPPATGVATGSVTFNNNGKPIGSGSLDAVGVATLSVSTLTLGVHSITALYGGDNNFSGSASPVLMITVGQASTSTTVSATPNPSVAGRLVTLSASVTVTAPGSGSPTGFIGFFVDNTVLTKVLVSSGKATVSTASLPAGMHTIVASYQGDANFGTSFSPAYELTITATPPTLAAAPLSMSFVQQSGAAPPAIQNIAVLGSVPGTPITLSVSTGASWLSVPSGSLTMPALIPVTVSAGKLAAGSYSASVTITGQQTNPAAQAVNISFTVLAAASQPALLAPQPAFLNFNAQQAGSSVSQPLVLAAVSGAVPFSAAVSTQDGGTWLSVSPDSGSVSPAPSLASNGGGPVTLTVQVNPAGLQPGIYSGSIVINGTTVPVTAFVQGGQPELVLDQTGFTVNVLQGATTAPPQSFGIAALGHQAVPWMVDATTTSGGGWLTVSPATGTSSPMQPSPIVTVTFNPSGLAAGTYYGTIVVTASEAGNTPLTATAVLNVLPAGATLAPVLEPSGMIFVAAAGGSPPAQQTVQAFGGAGGLSIVLAQAVLQDVPVAATILAGPPAAVQVQPSIAGLGAGVRQGALLILFSDNSVQIVNLVVVVAPAGTPISASSFGLQRAPLETSSVCAPTKEIVVFTELGSAFNGGGFSLPAAWPSPLEVKVVDDCANFMTTGSVVTTFSNGDPPLNMTSLGDGHWGATWQAQSVGSAITITTMAAVPPSGTAQVAGSVTANASAPLLGGAVNAASFVPHAPVAPGSLVSLFGLNLANSGAASSLPLPTHLGGSLSTLRGENLPLLYSSNGQINAQIPFDAPIGQPLLLLVQNGNADTAPLAVTIGAASPGVFTVNQSGTGQAAVQFANSTVVAASAGSIAGVTSRPATAGDVLTVYCTGLGTVSPPVPAGAAAPLLPLSNTVNTVTATIGGIPAKVVFSGLAPTFAGLYQVNVTVPPGVTPGNAVSLQLSIAGQVSPPVTIAVQ